jgi:pimeloyl-ACP methyl ester carboxylesterase
MRVEGGAVRARNEVPVFASFAPTAEQLGALRSIPLVTSVGGNSRPERFEAARALERLAGARVEVIEGAGNLVHVDQPAVFIDLVRRTVGARAAA